MEVISRAVAGHSSHDAASALLMLLVNQHLSLRHSIIRRNTNRYQEHLEQGCLHSLFLDLLRSCCDFLRLLFVFRPDCRIFFTSWKFVTGLNAAVMSGHYRSQRISDLDLRMKRIEEALERIVEHLELPKPIFLPPLPAHPPSLPPNTHDPVKNKKSSFRPTEPETAVEALKTGPYVYKPLDATKSEIRTLVLDGSIKDEAPVKAQLQHMSLEDMSQIMAIKFTALSYTWGDPTTTVDITLNGHQFPVSENLYAALKSVRQQKPSYWWVDAVCINQEDTLERNSQVAMMTMIFKMSSKVHIWLGGEEEDSDLGMDLIKKISAVNRAGPGDKEIPFPNCSMVEKIRHWQALTQLFQRPWWERVWVRQEVVVGGSARVQCGKKTCQFEQICDVAGILHSLVEQHGYQPIQLGGYSIGRSASTSGRLRISCYLRATMLLKLRNDLGSGYNVKYGDLTRLLFHTRSCKSTDPRDKVFSVLGLADPALCSVKPDYRTTLDHVLKTVTRAIITNKQSLDILAGCQNPEKENDLPSWVPNLPEDWKAHPFETGISSSVYLADKAGFAFRPDDDSILQANGRTIRPSPQFAMMW